MKHNYVRHKKKMIMLKRVEKKRKEKKEMKRKIKTSK
jgi:hypothetical protein